MNEIKDKIILAVKDAIANNAEAVNCDYDIIEIDCNDVDHIAEQVADTLIAANIGDVSWWERKCKLCEEDWFLQKKQIEHYAESYKEMLQEDLDKYKHRAEVAERALARLCDETMRDIRVIMYPSIGKQVRDKQELYDYCIEQAEREIAGEKAE